MPFKVRSYRPQDESTVLELWEQSHLSHPGNDPREMIARKLAFQPDLFLVGELEGEVVATVMAGYEGRRGWINLLAVAPGHRRLSLGRSMMEAAEHLLEDLGCPKVNLQVRSSNTKAIAFYERIGYGLDACFSMSRRLTT